MVQAAGSSAGLVLTRTIVHDVYGASGAARLSPTSPLMLFVPMLSRSPAVILLDHVGGAPTSSCARDRPWAPPSRPCRYACTTATRSVAFDAASSASRRPHSGRLFFSLIIGRRSSRRRLAAVLVVMCSARRPNTASGFAVAARFYVAGNYASGPARFERAGDPRSSSVPRHRRGRPAARAFLEWSTAVAFVPTIVPVLLRRTGIAPVQASRGRAAGALGRASGLMSGMQMAIRRGVVQLVGFTHQRAGPHVRRAHRLRRARDNRVSAAPTR